MLKNNNIELFVFWVMRNNADYDSAIEVVKVISSITKTKLIFNHCRTIKKAKAMLKVN